MTKQEKLKTIIVYLNNCLTYLCRVRFMQAECSDIEGLKNLEEIWDLTAKLYNSYYAIKGDTK